MNVPWRARSGSRWALAGLLIVVFIAATAPGVQANPGPIGTTAGFEDDDGDLVPGVPPMTPPINFDWNSFSPVTWEGAAPRQQATRLLNGWSFTGLTDAFGNNAIDDVFGSGVDQNTPCPLVSTSSGGGSDDLKRIYLAHKSVGGQVYLMLAWVRSTPQGSTSIMFEFNQGDTPCTNGSPFVQRTTGDFQILYDLQGANPPRVILSQRRWASSSNTWVQQTPLVPGVAEGAVNSGTGPWPDALAPETLNDETLFGEAGVNLSAAGLFNSNACQSFGRTAAISRASNSSSASMKDLVAPADLGLANCGTLVIKKVTDPVPDLSNTTFPFAVDGPRQSPPTGATAMPAGPFDLTPANAGSATTRITVAPGTGYSVSEVPFPANWELTGAACSNGESDVGTPDLAHHAITGISVDRDQTVTCTFNDASTVAALALQKTTVGAIGGPFTFTVQPVSGEAGSARTQEATTTAANVPAAAKPLTEGDATDALPPGSYLITETSPPPPVPGASWTPDDPPVCTSGNGTVPVTAQDSGFRIDLVVRTIVTCTFTNTFAPPPAAASLVLNKQTEGKTGVFTYRISGNSSTRTQVAKTQEQGVAVSAVPVGPTDATNQLAPGNYLISEESPDDIDGSWQGGAPECADATNGSVTATAQGNGYSVNLPAGSAISCTFTNIFTPTPASLVLNKVTIGNTGQFTYTVRRASDQNGQTWTQVATTNSENSPVQAMPAGPEDATNQLTPDTYLISESAPPSAGTWTPQFPDCNNGTSQSQPTAQPQSYTGPSTYNSYDVDYVVTLTPGGVVTCTFTNTYTPPVGSLVIAKVTQAPSDQQGMSFGFTADGPSDGLPRTGIPLSNDQTFRISVTPGSGFSLSEMVPEDWQLTSASCTDDTGGPTGSPTTQFPSSGPTTSGLTGISVAPGATVTCTFTNTYAPLPTETPTLTLTPTETPTSTPAAATDTPTATSTPTPAPPTDTPTATATGTPTLTPTAAPTSTPEAATNTPTATATGTPTLTPTAAPTSTPEAATNTPTATATSTPEAATNTPTPTATGTPITPVPGPVISLVKDAVPTRAPIGDLITFDLFVTNPSASAPAIATFTPTTTPSLTPSATPTTSITPTQSATLVVTASASPTASVTPSLTATMELTPTSIATEELTPTSIATEELTPTSIATASPLPTPTASGVVTDTPVPTEAPSPTSVPVPSDTPVATDAVLDAANVGASRPLAQSQGVPLVDVQVEDRVPDGLTFVDATDGGVYDPGTRIVRWALTDGLAPGATDTLSYAATLSQYGTWTTNACAVGLDQFGTEVYDCTYAVVEPIIPAPSPSATSTSSATPAASPTATPVLTPSATPPATQTPGLATATPGLATATPGLATPAPGLATPSTATPTPASPTATSPPPNTATPTPAPPEPSAPSPTPTFTASQLDLLEDTIKNLEARHATAPPPAQLPVQVPPS